METNKLTDAQLKEAFCEVRKAHRLIYEYQRRMQDLTWFIKNKLGFPDYKGYKKYSNTLSPRNTINYDYWSWDWIYTYVYEYYLGEVTTENNDNSWRLSVIQISDTGFYKNRKQGAVQTKINSYAPVEDSDSKLLFYLSLAPKETKDYDWNTDKTIIQYADETNPVKIEEHPKHIQIVYPVSLSKFVNEESTMQILRDFIEYCNKETGINFEIQE
jgi:hypothetical protein